MEQEVHKENLNKRCRVCGRDNAIPVDRKPYKKQDYCKEIFNGIAVEPKVDVSIDSSDIHPPFVCGTCRRRLDDYRKSKKKKPIKLHVHHYVPHDNNCEVCGCIDPTKPSIVQTVAKTVASKEGFLFVEGESSQCIFVTLDAVTLNVNRAICINRDNTWSMKVYGMTVPLTNEHLRSFPNRLTAGDIEGIFSTCKLQGCIGSPFAVFRKFDVPWDESSIFTDNHGNVKAQVDTRFMIKCGEEPVKMTIRYNNCCGLASSGSDICGRCLTYRGDLRSKLNPKRAKKDAGESSSHARHDRMTAEEKDKKLYNLKKDKITLRKHITALEKKVAAVMENESVELGEDEDNNLLDIVKKNETYMDLILSKESPMKLLWEEQKRYISHKDPRKHRWHPTIIRWCISLYEKSPAAYKMLRKSEFIKLPHQTTLHQYTHFTDAVSGINPDILEHLVIEAKLDTCPEREKNISILFDEMKIKSGLVFSQRNGKIIGFTEMGNINDEFASFERRVNNNEDPPLATHVLVIMVRGIFSGLKHPLAFYPSVGATGSQLFHILWEAVDILEFTGFKVRALVSDGAAPNRKFYSLHSSNPRSTSVTYCTDNPNSPARQLYFVCDVPHLLKTTRNCFENSGWNNKTRKLRFKGKPIIWEHVANLFDWDIGVGKTSPGLRQLHKLTPDHIHLKPATRMRVYMAAQVLSESVACAMELRALPETTSTVLFIRHMNQFFDCLNVSNLYQGRKGNRFKEPYRSMDDERFKYLTNDFLGFLDEWEKEAANDPDLTKDEKKRLCLSPQTLTGIRITVYSIVDLAQQLLSLEGVDYLLTEKFSQDPIEELFGDYRAAGGANDNPTTYQLGHTFNSRIVSGSATVRAITGSNVTNREREEDETFVISSEPLPKRRKKKD